jgi:hypothetical protein
MLLDLLTIQYRAWMSIALSTTDVILLADPGVGDQEQKVPKLGEMKVD